MLFFFANRGKINQLIMFLFDPFPNDMHFYVFSVHFFRYPSTILLVTLLCASSRKSHPMCCNSQLQRLQYSGCNGSRGWNQHCTIVSFILSTTSNNSSWPIDMILRLHNSCFNFIFKNWSKQTVCVADGTYWPLLTTTKRYKLKKKMEGHLLPRKAWFLVFGLKTKVFRIT